MKNIILLIAVLSSFSLIAQTDLPTGKIEVVKDFEVRLTETNKIRIVPQPVPLDSSGQKIRVQVTGALAIYRLPRTGTQAPGHKHGEETAILSAVC